MAYRSIPQMQVNFYPSYRYNWSFRTAIEFIQRKIYNFSIPDMEQIIDSLKN